MREKISLVVHLLHAKVLVAGRLAHDELESNMKSGLIHEVREWCERNHVPDPAKVLMSDEMIGEFIKNVNKQFIVEELAEKFFFWE